MSSPTAPDIEALIGAGRESANLEYKQSAPWDELKLGLIRTVLALANTQGGGHIVVGVAEDDGTFTPDGMTKEDIASFPTEDNFQAAVNGFAQPHVKAHLDRCEREGKEFLVISVLQFEDIPVLSKRAEGSKLRRAVHYVRSGRTTETAEMVDPTDQRNLFRLVVEKARDGSAPLTPANMRRDLRRHLQACERQWVRGIVPTQNDVFLERFWERIKSSRKDAEWKPVLAESITALQPDFLRPWKPIEDLGFDAIEAEGQFEASAPKLFEALEHAYALSTRDEVRQAHSTVVGHGQLLALRTWTLWGAYALSCENWAAVEALLHEQVSFITPRLTKPYRASFAEHKGFLYPDAAGHSPGRGVGDLAAQSIYSQPEQFAEEHFLDLEEMRTYIGLWLLASEIAYVTGESHLFWSIAPRSQLQRIIDRLEADSTYARNFTQAVFRTDPKEVNQTWQTAIVDPLLQNPRMRFFVGDLLPSRFAE